jgi:hypothetical protein
MDVGGSWAGRKDLTDIRGLKDIKDKKDVRQGTGMVPALFSDPDFVSLSVWDGEKDITCQGLAFS